MAACLLSKRGAYTFTYVQGWLSNVEQKIPMRLCLKGH